MKGLFITSTGTEIGKSLVTASLAYQRRMAGQSISALKPIISDFHESDPSGTDTAILADALGVSLTAQAIETISPFRYRAPLAPSMAADLEGRPLDYDAMLTVCRTALAANPFTLIEGVGGSFVPLVGDRLVADWIKDLGLPSLLVIGSYLGTISHTIATLEAMTRRGLTVIGIVMSESAGEGHPDLMQTAREVAKLTQLPLAIIPRLTGEKPWESTPDLLHLL